MPHLTDPSDPGETPDRVTLEPRRKGAPQTFPVRPLSHGGPMDSPRRSGPRRPAGPAARMAIRLKVADKPGRR